MKKVVNMVLVLLALALIALGVRDMLLYEQVDMDNNSLREVVVKIPDDGQGLDPSDPFNRQIDFEYLQSVNPDIKGWIYVPGTDVDYPILIGETDLQYQDADYTGTPNILGSLFTFAGVDLNANNHVCIFGHNMRITAARDDLMFGGLKLFKDSEYAYERMKAYIYTPDRTKECTLISAFSCHKTDEIFELNVSQDVRNLEELIQTVNSRSSIAFKIPDNAGQLYSLSTCDGGSGTPYRWTLHYSVTKEKYVLK